MEGLLARAFEAWSGEACAGGLEPFAPDGVLTPQLQRFLEQVEDREARRWMAAFEAWQEGREDPLPHRDGQCVTGVSSDALAAWVLVLPPVGEGAPVTPEDVRRELEQDGVCHGLVEGAPEACCKAPFRAFLAARGEAAVAGEDGKVEELYPRQTSVRHTTDHRGVVDFRDLNWLISIKTGETICNLTPPVPGRDGMTVTGRRIPPREGRMPPVPMGKNTKCTADGKRLIAEREGRLVFERDVFSVETCLVLRQNVAADVGNIAMPGDVVIKGNVEAGFTVYAKGNITVEGVVENAYLSARGDIRIQMGVKGDGAAVVEADGNIVCKFAENATLRAKGDVAAEYIINSDVSARKNLTLRRGRGTLIGGTVRVGGKLSATTIGNPANRMITIFMGMDPEVVEHLKENRRMVAQLEAQVAEHTKNIAFLEGREPLEPPYKKLLQQLRLQKSIQSMKIAHLQKGIARDEAMLNFDNCEITADTFYPMATIQFGAVGYQLQKTWRMCRLILRDGDVSVLPQ